MRVFFYFIFTKSIGLYINLLGFLFPQKASSLAFAFFSQPREGRLKRNKLPKILQEPESKTFQYNNHHFQAYIWDGNENVILLVHGWESNASRWENLLPYLKNSGSTVIAIDAPAHGLSSGKEFSIPQYAEFIHKTVETFKPQYLIGHSIGGKTCLYYQYKYPNDSVQKIVTLGAPSDFKVLLNNYISLLSLNAKIAKDLENKYINDYKQKIEDFSAQYFASKISIKGLIAHDKNDPVVSFSEGKKIAGAWKNSQFIETKDLGHSMHDDKLYQEVYTFLFLN